MSDKIKYPRALALGVAEVLVESLRPYCERITIAGSLRREKPKVGDIEILFVPRVERRAVPGDMFAEQDTNLAYLAIQRLIEQRILDKRLNVNGSASWGRWNKLAVHVPTGIPVDLFESTPAKWFNSLVVRTGPRELNERIATLAQKKGCRWAVYDIGFIDSHGDHWPMHSEKEVFDFVGLPYAEPRERK